LGRGILLGNADCFTEFVVFACVVKLPGNVGRVLFLQLKVAIHCQRAEVMWNSLLKTASFLPVTMKSYRVKIKMHILRFWIF